MDADDDAAGVKLSSGCPRCGLDSVCGSGWQHRWACTSRRILLLLPVIFVFTVFGPGLQCLSPLVVPGLALTLGFLHNVGVAWLAVLWLTLTLAATLAYLRIFVLVPAFAAAFMGVLCVAVLLPVRALRLRWRQHPRAQPWLPLLFPVGFTGAFALLELLLPSGSFASYVYAFVDFKPAVQATALLGLAGVNFAIAATASLGFEWFEASTATGRWLRDRQPLYLGGELAEDHSGDPDDPGQHGRQPAVGLATYVAALLLYGAARPLNSHGQLGQTPAEGWEQRTFRGGCIIEEVQDMQRALALTDAFAQRHGDLDLLLWSEAMITISPPMEEPLLRAAGAIAHNHSLLLGVAYKLADPTLGGRFTSRNMLVVLRRNGSVALRYQKVNPVVGIEWRVQPGPGPVPPILDERLGFVGAAICYDYSFPAFITQASKGADFMLQPGGDWGPLGFLHAEMDAVRAVENGFTMFRCTSGGVSGVYGPYGEKVFEKVTGGTRASGFVVDVPLRKGVGTVHSMLSGTPANLCIVLWLGIVALAAMPRLAHRLFGPTHVSERQPQDQEEPTC